jgi:hypothetical protein
MNADGYFMLGLLCIPFYVYTVIQDPEAFTTKDIILSNLNIVFVFLGSVSINLALMYGVAGIVQAIENLKTVWQIILVIII